MNIFLTGYSGFLGPYLAQALLDKGWSVRALLHRHGVKKGALPERTEIIWGSIDDRGLIREALSGMDAVVHSAWSFCAQADARPTINERAASILMAESIKAHISRFAFISSVAVYGMDNRTDAPIKEDFSPEHESNEPFMYPSEKISVERTLKDENRSRMTLGIFRPGPIIDSHKGPFKKILNMGPWHLGIGIGTGRNKMAYIHAKDVAQAVSLWLLNGNGTGIYNIVPSKTMSARQWIRLWGMYNGKDITPVFLPPSMFLLAQFGISLLKKSLGKETRNDMNYAIACAKRNISYSNAFLKNSLHWSDTYTAEFFKQAAP